MNAIKDQKSDISSQWKGAGLWNVYFIAKFALAFAGYLNLNLFYNALLFAWVVLPIRNRALNAIRTLIALAAGFSLIYSESWLPSVESIMANAGNVADFSLLYIAQLAVEAVNFKMVGCGFLILVSYLFIRDWVRVTALTVVYMAWLAVSPLLPSLLSQPATSCEGSVVAKNEEAPQNNAKGPAQSGASDSASINKWLEAFYAHEKSRQTEFPISIADKTPFDILLINICSLATDDLEVSGLTDHPVLKNFDIYFDKFNSATAYSGPATMRLLSASCGQSEHTALYDGRRPDCELLTRLQALGYEQSLFMDHAGKFDSYIESLQSRVGLAASLSSQKSYKVRYMGFDDEPIYDDADVFNAWLKSVKASTPEHRSATLMNLIALHDGNRLPGASKSLDFKPRAQVLLDQIGELMTNIQASGRRVMVIVVPEHGAAVRGDKIQMARLRDIPSPHLTRIPVMVKYFGAKEAIKPVHVTEETSYLALSELISRSLDAKIFTGESDKTVRAITTDLPQTYAVSENANAAVIKFGNKHFVRLNKGEWLPYAK